MSRSFIYIAVVLSALGLLVTGCGGVPATAPTVPAEPTLAPTLTAPAATVASAPAAPAATDSSATPAAGGASDGAVRIVVVPGQSEARYRVREQLASVSLPSDAIGKTSAITGTIVAKPDGTIVSSESKFTVDLRTLQSDRSQRDGFLRRSTLQSDQYPYATFVPTATQGLPNPPPTSGAVSFKLIGDLTIRNVTKPVTWDMTCSPQGNSGTCKGSTSFTFEYFNIDQPRVPVVLSVEDHITLELDVALQRAN